MRIDVKYKLCLQCAKLMLLTSLIGGCASIHQLSDYPEKPQAFGGIRTHITDFPYGHVAVFDQNNDWSGLKKIPGLIFIWWLPADIIISAGIDVIALPITIPAEFIRDKAEQRQP